MSNMHNTNPQVEITNGFAPTPADGQGVPTSMMWASGEDDFTPWSAQYGTYVGQDLVDSATALSMAGLDWGVNTAPLYIQGPDVYKDNEGNPILDAQGMPIPMPLQLKDNRAMVKDTDYTAFGVVGSRYHPIQNADAFQFLDGLVEDGELRYHTAGSLKGGRVVWILGQLKGNLEPVPGDPVGKFLLFSNTHDGSGALRIFWTSIRVCCMNTWRHALAEGKGKGITLKHTASIKNRLEQAREVLGLSRRAYDHVGEHLSQLAKVDMTTEALDMMIKALAPHPSDADPEAEIPTRTKNTRLKLVELFESGLGSDIKGVRGKAYQALNMATEYTNHHRGTWKTKGADHKLHNIWFGSSNDFHTKAGSWLNQYMQGKNPQEITQGMTGYTLAAPPVTQQQMQQVTLN